MSTDSCERDTPGIDPRMSTSDSKNIKITQHTGDSFKVMETYFRNQELTDVIIVAGDKRIPAHRLVLSAISKYFAERFKNSKIASTQNELKFTETDGNALFALIEYCYTGCIELRGENIETVSSIARLLEMSPVVKACRQFVSSERLDTGNCLRLKKLADTLEYAELSTAAHAHALEHFVDVMKTQQFLCLSAEDLAELLKSEDIIVPFEKTVFEAMIKWIQHDSENRSDVAGKLLSCVKLPLLSPTLINKHIEGNELIRSQKGVQDLVVEALMFRLLPEHKAALVQSGRARPRKSIVSDVLLAVGHSSIDAYFPGDDAWKNVTSMSDKRAWFCSALLEDKLLVLGGLLHNTRLNTVKSYDFSNLSWNLMSPMNSARNYAGAAVLDGFLYVVGGCGDSGFLNTVEKWDPVFQRWNYVAAMSTPRWGVSVAVLNNKLYAAGGLLSQTMECYDPTTDKWTTCAPMSTSRFLAGMGVVNGYLYVLGGRDGSNSLDSVERYDPKTNTWSLVAPMSVKRIAFGVGRLGSQLFVVGGPSDCETYDPDLNEWQQIPPLERSGDRSCVVVKAYVLRNLSF